jgi:hypothetical protein
LPRNVRVKDRHDRYDDHAGRDRRPADASRRPEIDETHVARFVLS